VVALTAAFLHWVAKVLASGVNSVIEVRATVRNYLARKIEQRFCQAEGYGVVFIMNASSSAEAHEILEKLPLGLAGMMEFELIPLALLNPLAILIGEPPRL
jgi:hypothetical protein